MARSEGEPLIPSTPPRTHPPGQRRTPTLMLFGASLSGFGTAGACMGKFSIHIHSQAVMGWAITAGIGLFIVLAKALYDYRNCPNKEEAKKDLFNSLTCCLIMFLAVGAIGAGVVHGIVNMPGPTNHGMV